jgi:hypothetical protein
VRGSGGTSRGGALARIEGRSRATSGLITPSTSAYASPTVSNTRHAAARCLGLVNATSPSSNQMSPAPPETLAQTITRSSHG